MIGWLVTRFLFCVVSDVLHNPPNIWCTCIQIAKCDLSRTGNVYPDQELFPGSRSGFILFTQYRIYYPERFKHKTNLYPWLSPPSLRHSFIALVCTSVSDPYPHGSAYRNASWIRIRMDRCGSRSRRYSQGNLQVDYVKTEL